MEQEQFKKEILPLREKLFLYARRLLDNPEDAEDIMQEVFLKLWYMRGELDYYNLDYFFMSLTTSFATSFPILFIDILTVSVLSTPFSL